MEAIGIHCIAELYDCPPGLLDDEDYIKQALRDSVDRGLATLLHLSSHHFRPQGVTALGLIAESHVAIHTWPEYGYAAVDVFTCGSVASAEKACNHLAEALRAGRHSVRKLERGAEVAGPAVASRSTKDAEPVVPAPAGPRLGTANREGRPCLEARSVPTSG